MVKEMIEPYYQHKGIRFFHCDCMDFMKEIPDNYYDLAIVDPPYGLQSNNVQFGSMISTSGVKRMDVSKWNQWNHLVPKSEYYDKLRRISKNQIVWGINYLGINLGRGRLVWYKKNTATFSDCELAYQSFTDGVYLFEWIWNGMIQQNMANKEKRIQPTQKPTALYHWILKKYAKAGQLIFDTHGGSMSSAIACYKEGYEMDICEIDKEYFDAGVKRFKQVVSQQELF